MFRCCNFSTMSTMVYINVLYFAVTVDPLILLLQGRVHPHPRCGTPTPPPLHSIKHDRYIEPQRGRGWKKIHRTPSYVHLKWKYNIRLPPKERPSRAKAARVQVVNMSWRRWKSAITCFISWCNQCAIYYVDSGSWFFASFHYLRFHPLFWSLICTF